MGGEPIPSKSIPRLPCMMVNGIKKACRKAMKRPHILPAPHSLCLYTSHSLANPVLFPGAGVGGASVGEQRAEAARG